MKKNLKNSEHYSWGDRCSGWHLVKSKALSVIEEMMPPNTEEAKHYHTFAQQFFYVLKGEATFKVMNQTIKVSAREGIHINPKVMHQIKNETQTNLEFLVISQPTSKGDRTHID